MGADYNRNFHDMDKIDLKGQQFPACWYCDNIIDHPEQVGLLYLGFPRCFVLIPNSTKFQFSTYEEFINGLSRVNWLDPKDMPMYSEEEKEEVLRTLWNFSIKQEEKEDELYEQDGHYE